MPGTLLFGGSFDPIHHGHLIVARAVAEQLAAPRVVLIPSAQPPHKLNWTLAPAAERLKMCQLAVANDPLFEASDWELGQPGPNFTLQTVERFRTICAGPLYWLIGMDSLAELTTWRRVADLAAACTLVTARRPGFDVPDLGLLEGLIGADLVARIRAQIKDTPQIDISATELRRRVRAGQSIRYLAPEAVVRHIEQRGLYAAGR